MGYGHSRKTLWKRHIDTDINANSLSTVDESNGPLPLFQKLEGRKFHIHIILYMYDFITFLQSSVWCMMSLEHCELFFCKREKTYVTYDCSLLYCQPEQHTQLS